MKTLDKEIELLRKRAEAALLGTPSGATDPQPPQDMADAMRLVEELRVYQTELEIQNQDLKSAQLRTEAAMRKYRRVFENLPLESVLIDAQGFIVEANAVARKKFSLHQQTALQRRSAYQLFAMDSRIALHAALTAGKDLAHAPQCQLVPSAQDGTREVDAHIISTDPDSPTHDERLMVLVDRTFERQLSLKHEEISRSEARYRALFNGSKVPMLLVDPVNGAIVRANAAAQSFYGYDEPTLQGMRITDINCLSAQETRAEMAQAAAEQRSHFFFTHRLSSGREVPVEVHSGPIEMDGRTLLYSIVHDITDRVLAQQRADAAHALLTNLAQQVPGVIYQFQLFPDGRSCFPFASQGIGAIYGVTPEQVMADATAVFSALHPQDRDRVSAVDCGCLPHHSPHGPAATGSSCPIWARAGAVGLHSPSGNRMEARCGTVSLPMSPISSRPSRSWLISAGILRRFWIKPATLSTSRTAKAAFGFAASPSRGFASTPTGGTCAASMTAMFSRRKWPRYTSSRKHPFSTTASPCSTKLTRISTRRDKSDSCRPANGRCLTRQVPWWAFLASAGT
jgi:PAS domain S-box-containing protein